MAWGTTIEFLLSIVSNALLISPIFAILLICCDLADFFSAGEKYESKEIVRNGLPYELVKATAAIDLWSLGGVLGLGAI